jgi:hypothetical protein
LSANYDLIGRTLADDVLRGGCRIDGLTGDDEVTVSVTLTQDGATETLSATAIILAVCGNVCC